jgi:hypothetical protein
VIAHVAKREGTMPARVDDQVPEEHKREWSRLVVTRQPCMMMVVGKAVDEPDLIGRS